MLQKEEQRHLHVLGSLLYQFLVNAADLSGLSSAIFSIQGELQLPSMYFNCKLENLLQMVNFGGDRHKE